MDQAVKLCGYSNKMINLWTQTRKFAEIISWTCTFPVSPSCLHTFVCITSRSVPFVSLTPTSEQVWSPTFWKHAFCVPQLQCTNSLSWLWEWGGGGCMYVSVSVDVCVWCKLPQVLTHAPKSPFIQSYEPTWASLWVNSNSSASVEIFSED